MRSPQSTSIRRRSVPLSLVLIGLLSAGCKDKLEDLPDIDPVDDDWVNQIDSGNEELPTDPAAVGPAEGDPAVVTAEPSPAVDGSEPGTEGEPTELAANDAPVDPATAEAAKLAGANVPSSKPTAGGSDKQPTPPPPGVEPEPEPDGSNVAPEPAPTPEPAAKPAEPAPTPAKPAPAPITMADYNGKYRFSGGSAQRQALAEAIEFGANQVAGIIRGIARKRLTKTQIIEDPVTISVNGDQLEFAWATTGEGMVCTIDGPTTTMKYGGDKYNARCRSKDGKLITSFQAPDATKTIVYTLSSDRRSLTAHHRLVADQLSEPVTFKVSYTRQ